MSLSSDHPPAGQRVLGFSPGERTVGFPAAKPAARPADSTASAPSEPPRRLPQQPPAAKRPKGRWFISLVIGGICSVVFLGLFNEFLRYQAYGVIDGRVLRVSAPWTGSISSLHAQEDDYVRQGQLLATIENTDVRLQLAALRERVRIAQAALQARIAELRLARREESERLLRLRVDYFQLLARLCQQRALLDDYRVVLHRQQTLRQNGATSPQDADTARHRFEGQRSLVAQLQRAADQMQEELKQLTPENDDSLRLAAEQAQVEGLLSEWKRLAELESLGEIRSPVEGRVVRRHHFTGEVAAAGSVILEVLEAGSVRAVVFLPQRAAKSFRKGDEVHITIPPYRQSVNCTVEHFGNAMQPAPDNLRRYYRRDEGLVAMSVTPRLGEHREDRGDEAVWLGAEVRLPRFNLSLNW